MKNIFISILLFGFCYSLGFVSKSVLVQDAILYVFLIMWITFIPAALAKTEKFYDLAGSLTYIGITSFIYIATYGLTFSPSLLIVFAVLIWAIRLGNFLFKRVLKDGQDKRFSEIKIKPSSFFAAWTTQGLWVAICALSAWTAIASQRVELPIVLIGFSIFLLGFVIEVVADKQKTDFRSLAHNQDAFITTGLWSKSRHPNYFGEIVLWIGIALMGAPFLEGIQLVTLISPIFTFVLIYFVSGVRILEDRADTKWGGQTEYESYKASTPIFFPKIFS